MMSSSAPKPVLAPEEALKRYREELCLHDKKGRLVVLPGVIGTVFFRDGSTLEVRKGILACFDRFAELFGEYLKGGRGAGGYRQLWPQDGSGDRVDPPCHCRDTAL